MATPRPPDATAPGQDKRASPHVTTPAQQANIRLVFQHEFGITSVQSINVESTVLYNALSTKRHADIDAEDDGSYHSEVLKNAIDLLQRFHRCAPLYPKMDLGHKQRNNNFFAKDVYCRTFCKDIEGFDNKDNPRAWIDVFHFFQAMKKIWDGSLLGGLRMSSQAMVAAGFEARKEVTKSRDRSRKGAVLWALMGLTSKAIDRTGNTRPETWCVEAAIRVGMWRRMIREHKESMFRLPVEDNWGPFSDNVLPERDGDAMKLFNELETKFRAFYIKCKGQMPEQATSLPEIPKKLPNLAPTPRANQDGNTRNQQGSDEMTQQDGTSDENAPETIVANDVGRDFISQKIIKDDFMPHPLKQAYHHWALTHKIYEQATPRKVTTTEATWQFSGHRDPAHRALEQAKKLITNVLQANGLEPNWDPEWPPRNGGQMY